MILIYSGKDGEQRSDHHMFCREMFVTQNFIVLYEGIFSANNNAVLLFAASIHMHL